jgi:glycosyltransferase involved in cell wall biosynthesis
MDARWRKRFAAWLERCAAVIVPSASARADLLASHGTEIAPERVHAIPHGADPFARPPDAELARVRERYAIGGRYGLFVGGLEPRKNLDGLLEAFKRVDTDAWLVIAGGRVNWIPGESARLERTVASLTPEVRRRIVMTGYVSEPDKAALLAGADLLAYPSRYEGFGFPVLEGFAAGVPVLTSTTSSLPEVAGDAAVLVDPNDPGEIAQGLGSLFGDDALRARLAAAGTERVADFTWEASARRTAEVLRLAAQRRD